VSGVFSEYLDGFTFFINDDARCGSNQRAVSSRFFFNKKKIRREIPEEPVR
jgi:hypothetical protein